MTKLYRRFTDINPSRLLLAPSQFWLPGWDTFVVCIPLGSLLTVSVTGVGDSFAWGQQDRGCWEILLSTQVWQVIPSLILDCLHRTAVVRPVPDDAEDGPDDLGLRVVCQNVDNPGADLYYDNDYYCHNSSFFLSRPNRLALRLQERA